MASWSFSSSGSIFAFRFYQSNQALNNEQKQVKTVNQELEKTTKDLRENEKQLREALRESQENEEAAQTSAREANKQKAIATATRLSVQAVQATENPSQLNGYPDLGLLLAKEAGRLLIEEGEGEDKDSLIFNNQGRSLKASETIQKYLRQKSPILSLSYSPDGKTLASGSSDNRAIVWDDLAPYGFMACQKAGRNLTLAEWERYLGDLYSYQKTCDNLPYPEDLLTFIASNVEEVVLTIWQPERGNLDKKLQELAKLKDISKDTLFYEAITNLALESKVTESSLEDLARSLSKWYLAQGSGENNNICWQGSISNHAQYVIDNCERAVEISKYTNNLYSHTGVLDSRGVAFVMLGEEFYPQAITDFKAFIDIRNPNDPEPYTQRSYQSRSEWIGCLEQGKNPFTPEILDYLKQGEQGDYPSAPCVASE
ncbi:MAG: hypothetical protein R2880_08530 [Deinococcales bacterium]